MPQYLLAHDLGTTGNKATLYDEKGELRGSAVYGYAVAYPHDGWAEQNPRDWWEAVCRSTRQLLEQTGIRAEDVACVSFSAQMMGCLLVDGAGEPLRPMITWADTRSAAQEKRMIEAVGMERGYRITGHRLSASYSAAKLLWVKDNEPDVYNKAYKLLNAKDYIIHKLTGAFVTDYSDASGTNLLDLTGHTWSDELVSAFGIRKDLLPELHASSDIAGKVTAQAASECGLCPGTPVVLGGGDGSCACVGAGVVKEGRAYNVIGTSSWISYAARAPHFDDELRTFNWVHLDENLFTPCGTMQAAGLSYHWFRDALCPVEVQQAARDGEDVYELLNRLALQTPAGARGLLYLPYLIGERSPRWNHNARGAFIGLGAGSGRGDMARAVLEGVGYNLKVILDIFEGQKRLDDIVMIGGGAKGRAWVHILADIWQRTLLVPRYIEEATSMGAAICGGVGVGLYSSFAQCADFNPIVERIEPDPSKADVYARLYAAFNRAYEQLVPIYDMLASEHDA
jgi:xylulokinase